MRHPLAGGTGQRHFDGTSLTSRKLPENAATPTSRAHAVSGSFENLMKLTFHLLQQGIGDAH